MRYTKMLKTTASDTVHKILSYNLYPRPMSTVITALGAVTEFRNFVKIKITFQFIKKQLGSFRISKSHLILVANTSFSTTPLGKLLKSILN